VLIGKAIGWKNGEDTGYKTGHQIGKREGFQIGQTSGRIDGSLKTAMVAGLLALVTGVAAGIRQERRRSLQKRDMLKMTGYDPHFNNQN